MFEKVKVFLGLPDRVSNLEEKADSLLNALKEETQLRTEEFDILKDAVNDYKLGSEDAFDELASKIEGLREEVFLLNNDFKVVEILSDGTASGTATIRVVSENNVDIVFDVEVPAKHMNNRSMIRERILHKYFSSDGTTSSNPLKVGDSI